MTTIEKIENSPTVSVILPTYNRAHLVGRAIQSVLNQTYQDFELIVVDDGSIDNTEEVVKSINDARIRYLKYEKNRGGATARNTGIIICHPKVWEQIGKKGREHVERNYDVITQVEKLEEIYDNMMTER